MSRMFALATLLAILAIPLTISVQSAERASSADWPQFRGPNRDNLSPDKGLLTHWPADGPPLAWKAEGVGGGYSSVSLADGRVFTMGDKGGFAHVTALDQATGKILWSAKAGRPGGNTGSTPTVDGNLLYTISQAGDLVCLE